MEIIFYVWLMCLLGGPALIFFGHRRFIRYRLMEDMPTSHSNSAAMGTVEMQGYAWPSKPTIAPLSGENVSFYSIAGYKHVSKYAETEVFRVFSSPFFLTDLKGCVQIQADEDMVIQARATMSRYVNDLERAQIEPVKKLAMSSGRFEEATRLEEVRISVGSQIYAMGTLAPLNSEERMATPLRGINEFMLSQRKRFILDFIRDGRKSLPSQDAPWAEEIGRAGKKSLAAIPTERPWEKCHGVLRRKHDGPLFIADAWQEQLIGSRYAVAAYYAVGTLLLAIALTVGLYLAYVKFAPGAFE